MNIPVELSAEIDACKYIYLRKIFEPQDNKLILIIEEANASITEGSISLPGGVTLKGSEIRSDVNSRLFELTWDFYVAYSVRNESFVTRDESEKIESGRLLQVYSNSKFLDYVASSTFATDEHPGPTKHIEIVCLNHIVDVISTKFPEIRLLQKHTLSQHGLIQ